MTGQKESPVGAGRGCGAGRAAIRSIKPPTPHRVDKIVRTGLHQPIGSASGGVDPRRADRRPAAADVRARLLSLVAVADPNVDGVGIGDLPPKRRHEHPLTEGEQPEHADAGEGTWVPPHMARTWPM